MTIINRYEDQCQLVEAMEHEGMDAINEREYKDALEGNIESIEASDAYVKELMKEAGM